MIRKHLSYVKKPYEFYGFAPDCTYRAENIQVQDSQTSFRFCYKETSEDILLNVLGDHNVSNALAAIAIGLKYQVPIETIKTQLSTFSGQRQNIIHSHGYTIIDDSYNASPDSMKASLKILSNYKSSGRKIAVLSDMLELGENAPEYHREVGRFLASTNVTDLYITGELSKEYIAEASSIKPSIRTRHFESNGDLVHFLEEFLTAEDVLLVKASNGMKLKEVSDALT